jgi:hypothetical protein
VQLHTFCFRACGGSRVCTCGVVWQLLSAGGTSKCVHLHMFCFKALRMHAWNAADIILGGGSRVCIGRHLATMELYKIVATLVSRFHIKLVDPTATWKVTGSWFPRGPGVQAAQAGVTSMSLQIRLRWRYIGLYHVAWVGSGTCDLDSLIYCAAGR